MSAKCTNNGDCSAGSFCVKSVCQTKDEGPSTAAWIGIGVGGAIVFVLAVSLFIRCRRRKKASQARKDQRLGTAAAHPSGPAPLPAGYVKPVDLLQVAQINKINKQRLSVRPNSQVPAQYSQGQPQYSQGQSQYSQGQAQYSQGQPQYSQGPMQHRGSIYSQLGQPTQAYPRPNMTGQNHRNSYMSSVSSSVSSASSISDPRRSSYAYPQASGLANNQRPTSYMREGHLNVEQGSVSDPRRSSYAYPQAMSAVSAASVSDPRRSSYAYPQASGLANNQRPTSYMREGHLNVEQGRASNAYPQTYGQTNNQPIEWHSSQPEVPMNHSAPPPYQNEQCSNSGMAQESERFMPRIHEVEEHDSGQKIPPMQQLQMVEKMRPLSLNIDNFKDTNQVGGVGSVSPLRATPLIDMPRIYEVEGNDSGKKISPTQELQMVDNMKPLNFDAGNIEDTTQISAAPLSPLRATPLIDMLFDVEGNDSGKKIAPTQQLQMFENMMPLTWDNGNVKDTNQVGGVGSASPPRATPLIDMPRIYEVEGNDSGKKIPPTQELQMFENMMPLTLDIENFKDTNQVGGVGSASPLRATPLIDMPRIYEVEGNDSGKKIPPTQQLQMVENMKTLNLDTGNVIDTTQIGAAPLSPLRATPLIEFSPAVLAFKEPFILAEYEAKEEHESPSRDLRNSPTDPYNPHGNLEDKKGFATTILESQFSSASMSHELNDANLESYVLPAFDQSQNQAETLSETPVSYAPPLPPCQVSEFDPLNISTEEENKTEAEEIKAEEIKAEEITAEADEITAEAEVITSPLFSDQMNTLFSNLSSSSISLELESPQESTTAYSNEAVENVQKNVVDETFSTAPNSARASENGESVQTLNTLVEPSSFEPVKIAAKRPAGSRPMPTHMKFS